MSNPTLELRHLRRAAVLHWGLDATVWAVKATGLLTLGREVCAFLNAVATTNVRKDMIECADRLFATQPGLARRLRRAANGGWSC